VRPDDDAPARQTLAGVVVRVTGEPKRHAVGHEGAKALARGPVQVNFNQVIGQISFAERARNGTPVKVPTARLTLRTAVANRKGVVRDAALTAS